MLKNAIDWLSRPALASVLRWKPVAIIGASTGRGGTRRAQQQVRDALLFPGAIVLDEPEVAVPVAWEHFDEDGRLVDEKTRDPIRTLVEGLATPRGRDSAPKRHSGGVRAEHGIEAESLVRTFKGDIRAVDGIDLRRGARRDLRLPRPERRGQVDDGAHADDAAPADLGHGARRGLRHRAATGPKVRSAIGAALQEAALDNLLTGREHLSSSARCTGSRAASGASARRSCSSASASPWPPTARSAATRAG